MILRIDNDPKSEPPSVIDTGDGRLLCPVCGAETEKRKRKRFLTRHPKLCLERKKFTSQVAAGTRHLDDLDIKGIDYE